MNSLSDAEAAALAPAIHEHYRQQARREGWTMRYDMPYDELPAELRHANLAAARRIPAVLAAAGLRVASISAGSSPGLDVTEVGAILEAHIEPAALAEHEGWMAEKLESGWRHGPGRDDAAKVHPSLVPYASLSDEEKEKDRSAVRNYPAILARAGMGACRRP